MRGFCEKKIIEVNLDLADGCRFGKGGKNGGLRRVMSIVSRDLKTWTLRPPLSPWGAKTNTFPPTMLLQGVTSTFLACDLRTALPSGMGDGG